MWLRECLISTEHLMVHTAMPQALWPLYRQAEAPPHTGQVRQAIRPTQQLLCSAFHMLNIVSPEKDGNAGLVFAQAASSWSCADMAAKSCEPQGLA